MWHVRAPLKESLVVCGVCRAWSHSTWQTYESPEGSWNRNMVGSHSDVEDGEKTRWGKKYRDLLKLIQRYTSSPLSEEGLCQHDTTYIGHVLSQETGCPCLPETQGFLF